MVVSFVGELMGGELRGGLKAANDGVAINGNTLGDFRGSDLVKEARIALFVETVSFVLDFLRGEDGLEFTINDVSDFGQRVSITLQVGVVVHFSHGDVA